MNSLTVPEQLLIALLYPRVFVFKLYPKLSHHQTDPSTLQRAMRGTISTYELNTKAVADMIEGRLMPRPASILASLISITFLSKKQVPKTWFHNTFRVRRQVVWQALIWLKENNPKYYGEIELSPERLSELPENDIPLEVTSIVKENRDVDVVDEESGGYVRETSDVGEPENKN